LIKLDENGDTIWVNHYGWGDYHYYTQAVLVEPDGGYILAGDIQSPYYEIPPAYFETGALIIKVDANGDTLWTGRYNDSPGTYSYSVRSRLIQKVMRHGQGITRLQLMRPIRIGNGAI
jgi:hypothetical protein